MHGNSFREVPLIWAGQVRTGNKQTFDYAKDYEVTCRFNEPLTRERIYKEIEKAKWPFSRVVGMVLKPGNLVDFTLKSKDSTLMFAQALNNLDFIRSASAYADRVVEVRIDFIPQDFPQNQFQLTSNKTMEKLLELLFEYLTDLIFKLELGFLK